MCIARRADRLSEPLSQSNNPLVYVLNILWPLNFRITRRTVPVLSPDEELIVPGRLDFEIIVKFCDLRDRLFRSVLEDCLIQFACNAGTADDDSLAVLYEFALRDSRLSLEILEMRIRNHRVEIEFSRVILREQDAVIERRKMLDHLGTVFREAVQPAVIFNPVI